MSALTNEITSDTLAEVELHYMNRNIAKWWNANRSKGDTRIFCGWYWVKGKQEGGPFNTQSGALRDAYYRFVLHQELPRAWKTEPPVAVMRKKRVVAKKKPVKRRTAHHETRVSP